MAAFEYSVLVTSLDAGVVTIVQHYRDRADCENNFDEIKNTVGLRGVAIFAKACFGHPSPSKWQKLNATTNAFGAPDVLRTSPLRHTFVNSALAT